MHSNPERDALMRRLWRERGPARASAIFFGVDGSSSLQGYAPLAQEALKLDREGLIAHEARPGGALWMRLTLRGQARAAMCHVQPGRVVAGALAPVLVSCAVLQPMRASVPASPASAVMPLRMEQLVVNGEVVWGGRLRKRKIKHVKPVAALAMA